MPDFSRCILHSDLNNFYASVEMLRDPALREVPLAVCGSFEDRHGVVLAKNMPAKEAGVKTGEPFFQARKKCPKLVSVPADFPSYVRVSQAVREIYARYTDRIEPFGIDECWLDVTGSRLLFGSGREIADAIRESVKREIGVTVSVGVSFNKIFAKLGSDMKKPDAVTEITPENYRETAWALPVSDLLYVGKATARKLSVIGIATIGDLARCDEGKLIRELGKWGKLLHDYAAGEDRSPVALSGAEREIKSIGNSLTCYRDLTTDEDVHRLFLLLSDSVAARLSESKLGRAGTVKITVTDSELNRCGKQGKPSRPTRSASAIADCAMQLFRTLYPWEHPVRALGVSVCDFTGAEQLTLFGEAEEEERDDRLEAAVRKVREKYGNRALQRAEILGDKRLAEMDVKGAHIIHPEGRHGE